MTVEGARPAKRKPRSGALDAALGARVRRLRRGLGLSQAALAEELGITFQQVQKYENGVNRISALMLVKIAQILKVGPAELLADLDPKQDPQVTSAPGAARLLQDFSRIPSPALRQVVLDLASSLAEL